MPPDVPSQQDPRVFLAIERTFLAWARTALALMGFGFVLARIGLFLREVAVAHQGEAAQDFALAEASRSLWLGTALVVVGLVVQGFALMEHRQQVRRFRRGEIIVSGGWSLSMLVGLALIAIGIAMVAYLVHFF